MKSTKNNSLLWRIEHPEIQSPTYLFGTMHVRDARAFARIETIQQYISQCDKFAAEFDLSESNETRYTEAILLPEGQVLTNMLPPKIYKKLAKIFSRETGHELQAMLQYKPIAILNVLTEAQFRREERDSLDDTLYQFAQIQAKKICGLETFEEQLQILAKLDDNEQIRQLARAAKNFSSLRRQIKKSINAYCSGDLSRIHQIVKKANNSAQRKLLLRERNTIMVERLFAQAETGSLFAAVGAAHLAGKHGMLRLLRQKGCKIMPVKY